MSNGDKVVIATDVWANRMDRLERILNMVEQIDRMVANKSINKEAAMYLFEKTGVVDPDAMKMFFGGKEAK